MNDYISREAAIEIVKRTSGDYAAAFRMKASPLTSVSAWLAPTGLQNPKLS